MRAQADILHSLQYLKTRFLGLTKCHPIFRSCGSSPWEVEKATTQACLLSGRYRVESLSGHWVPWNRVGNCSLHMCWGTPMFHKGPVESFLISCPSLSTTRHDLAEYNRSFLKTYPDLVPLVDECLCMDPVQFWVDCSPRPPVMTCSAGGGGGYLVCLV